MQAMATRYRGRVQAYELWNEQNLAREAGDGNVTPDNYLPLLRAGYTGVKAATRAHGSAGRAQPDRTRTDRPVDGRSAVPAASCTR